MPAKIPNREPIAQKAPQVGARDASGEAESRQPGAELSARNTVGANKERGDKGARAIALKGVKSSPESHVPEGAKGEHEAQNLPGIPSFPVVHRSVSSAPGRLGQGQLHDDG